jgi:hypothetical protein
LALGVTFSAHVAGLIDAAGGAVAGAGAEARAGALALISGAA